MLVLLLKRFNPHFQITRLVQKVTFGIGDVLNFNSIKKLLESGFVHCEVTSLCHKACIDFLNRLHKIFANIYREPQQEITTERFVI